MTEALSLVILLLAPTVPLLFILLPSLRKLPSAQFLTVLPMLLALLVNQSFNFQAPLLNFQITIGFGAYGKWLLGYTILLWLVILVTTDQQRFRQDQIFTSFLLLTIASSLANVVTHSLLGFYLFYTLLGYACYGVLIRVCGKQLLRTAKIYLVLQILGDLILFELCLSLAAKTGVLSYTGLYTAIVDPEAQSLLLGLALLGIIAKAGIWPLHFWLPLLYRHAPASIMILLGIIIPSVGIVGWFNLVSGVEITASEWPERIQMIGLAGLVYSVLVGLAQKLPGSVLAYALIALEGLLIMMFGHFLDHPAGIDYPTILLIFPIIHYVLACTALVLSLKMPASIVNYPARLWIWFIPACLWLTGTIIIAMMIAGPGGSYIPSPAWWSVTALTLLIIRFGYLAQSYPQEPPEKPHRILTILQAGIILSGLANLIYWITLLFSLGFSFSDFFPTVMTILPGLIIAFSIWRLCKGWKIIEWLYVPPGDLVIPFEFLGKIILQQANNFGQVTLPAIKAQFLNLIGFPWTANKLLVACQKGEKNLQYWRTAIILMLSLGLMLTVAVQYP
jgi:NADH:ubiquinone oxidoreductase subunit 2 (subunit N)